MENTDHREIPQSLKTAVMQRIHFYIHFDEWDYTCGDGCLYYFFGTRLVMNGKNLEHQIQA
jgi:hypothetical protein